MVFAYNRAVPFIETNLRTVYLHHFFKDATAVPDSTLLQLTENTFSNERPREWGWALMDYGSHLKAIHGNASKRSATYKKQTPFKDSNRYVRGAILRLLATSPQTTLSLIKNIPDIKKERVELALDTLKIEGLVIKHSTKYSLP
jgi:A/G-specific adenine glycosylase